MREILPGVFHWTAQHDGIGMPVSSYYVAPADVLVDPKLPQQGFDGLASIAEPRQIVLTSGLHVRDAPGFADAFRCAIRAPREAAARLGGKLDFEPYDDGEELAPGVTGLEIGGLAPDEGALHLAMVEGAIVFADALNHYGDELSFFPDQLLGDDPLAVKRALTQAFEGLLSEHEFDHLLFAHGEPIVGGARAMLRDFVARQSAR